MRPPFWLEPRHIRTCLTGLFSTCSILHIELQITRTRTNDASEFVAHRTCRAHSPSHLCMAFSQLPTPHAYPCAALSPFQHELWFWPHADGSASDSIESDDVTSPELSSSSGEPPARAPSLPKQFLQALWYSLASGGSSPRISNCE